MQYLFIIFKGTTHGLGEKIGVFMRGASMCYIHIFVWKSIVETKCVDYVLESNVSDDFELN